MHIDASCSDTSCSCTPLVAKIGFLLLEQQTNPKALTLTLEVTTRLNSMYDMIVRYLELHPAVYASFTELCLRACMP